MNKPNYYELPDHVQVYLHTLELHAVIQKMRTYMTQDEITHQLQKKLNHKTTPEAWSTDINTFVMTRFKKPVDREDMALYYLVAGVGINKIQNLVKIGQPAIYRERDRADWSHHHSPLERMFITDDFALQQVHVLANAFNIMDGYRVTQADQLPISYTNRHENFKKKKKGFLSDDKDARIIQNHTPEEEEQLQVLLAKMRADTERAEEEKRQRLRAIMLEED